MSTENNKKAKTNAYGVTVPVRPRNVTFNTLQSTTSDARLKQIVKRHKVALDLLAKR